MTFDSSSVSGIGEWLSNDPIGISGGLNQYVFCGNNPVNARDPMGWAADLILFDPKSDLYSLAQQHGTVPDVNGDPMYTVAAHGTHMADDPEKIALWVTDARNGTEAYLTPDQLADEILKQKNYTKGRSVYLEACDTGRSPKGDPDSYAQKLADALTRKSKTRTTVHAPTRTGYYFPPRFNLESGSVRLPFEGRFGTK